MDPLQLLVQFLMSPRTTTWLKKNFLIPLLRYEARVGELKLCIQNLKKARDVVKHKVKEEENRYGRRFADEVKEWIQGVDKIISEYEDFDEDERKKDAVFDLFTSGFLPKPGIRYHLSEKAFNITRKVNELEQKAKHDAVSYWLGPPSMVAFFTNVGYESFPSRDETVTKINAALEDPNVRMIGLHGLSGVGKTSLVKRVAKEALEAKMFDVVTMASITRNADIRKIQGQIADMLGMKLDEESDIARAARIQERLKNEKESTLIILDDLWAEIDFNVLGIPSDDDERKSPQAHSMIEMEKSQVAQSTMEAEFGALNMMKLKKKPGDSNKMKTEETPSHYKGCKVLMISESKKVLKSHMEGKGNSIFYVEVLKEKEAEMLFKKKAGIGDTNSDLEILAAQIAKKCNGLPVSIVTTARALKNQSRSVWENINRELEGKNLMGAPEFSTKLSYDLLENEELKYTFLLCARMGHDALIMDLVRSYIGLGFLQGIYTVREAKDRVYALVGKLKESGLLSESYSNDHFTMQDIVRSAALSIALEEKHVFTMTKGKIDEWPDEDKLKRFVGISLQHCDIISGFPRMLNCPQLRFFHVDNSYPRLKLPDNFFKGMKELKVLILTGFDLSPLPWTIRYLTKLRMLSLEGCTLGEELAYIGELKNLRILSFSKSDIKKLPVELKELTKLQILDISNCSKLQKIPSNVINSLISLEELYIGNTLIEWNIEGQTNQSEHGSLSELRHLNQLATLDLRIPNVDHLPKNLFFDKLYSYKIIIGELKAYLETDFKMPEKYETSRFLAMQLNADIHSLMGIKMLFGRVEILLLEDLNGVQDIFYTLNLKGFPYLKHLCIVSNSHIQSLINPTDRQQTDRQQAEEAFLKLESLYLYDLKIMDKICSCKLSAFSFGKLKAVKIYQCSKLKSIFYISMVRHLTVLETIEVSECNTLKEIVPMETQSNTEQLEETQSKTEQLEFPELRTLTLQSLPQLTGFYPISSTGELFHEKVIVSKLERMELSSIHIDVIWSEQPSLCSSFQNLIHLDVNECWKLKYLLSFSMAKTLVNLQSLSISECENMGHIFLQELGSHAETKGRIFPNLKKIKLSCMKRLSEIWNYELPSDSFGKLDTLIIEQCDKFVNVFPCYMKGIFRSLCNLSVTNCRSMKEIFDLNDKNGDASDVANLQDVHLEALPKLKHVWKRNKDWEIVLNLKKLQKIWVHDCGSLEYIFPFDEAKCLPNLEYLVVWDCSELWEIVDKGKAAKT
ncbi:probable disease resistance protein At4g27220 [Gastrolobium bilobum]|uniref:probable disease resistance protein At4g27220 n=1 Tax=Gastrolobium bilobum TaxID=150636 RepID=UPI002AB060F3|nr:probable disease resistance protein At4g27220 [Gastrolobium bilobum]